MYTAGAVIQTLVSRIQLIWPVFAMRLEKKNETHINIHTLTHTKCMGCVMNM